MKMAPDYIKAQKNMRAGVISREGFLGTDDRPLMDIIEADEEEVQALELTFDQIAEKMKYLEEKGEHALGEPTTVDGKWMVRSEEVRGMLASPFEDGIFHKSSVHVKHLETNLEIIYSNLSLHLLEKYHFLQGKGSIFRLEPTKLKTILEL